MSDKKRTAWDRLRKRTPAMATSLVIHAAILAVLGMLTWAVAMPDEPDRLLTLSTGESSAPEKTGGAANPDRFPEDPAGAGMDAAAEAALQPPAAPATAALDAAADTLIEQVPLLPNADGLDGIGDLMKTIGADSLGDIAGGAGAVLTGVSASFGDEIKRMRKAGLDVVLILDATGSMRSVLDQAKERLGEVIDVISYLVPGAQFGIIAFKEYDQGYGPSGLRVCEITGDRQTVQSFLDGIVASGGGDRPEPIDAALVVAVRSDRMGWRNGSRRVIVLVGDAPVHDQGRDRAYEAARQFSKTYGGRINAIDVRLGHRGQSLLPDFQQIATCGGGAAFGLGEREAFWRRLVVSVFGHKHSQDVEAIIERVLGKR